MTKRVKALYSQSLSDGEFLLDISKLEDESDWLENAMSDNSGRHLLAMCYWGWLVAKGKAKEVKDSLPPKL